MNDNLSMNAFGVVMQRLITHDGNSTALKHDGDNINNTSTERDAAYTRSPQHLSSSCMGRLTSDALLGSTEERR